MPRLVKIINITKIMRLESGLRIAGGEEDIKIGGIDNPIIRDPLTGEPYIPGSSLKGSMRSGLEIALGKNDICACGDCVVCLLFGKGQNKDTEDKRRITRLIVRDAFMTRQMSKILNQVLPSGVEIKNENTIDRVQGKAGNKRTFDRIPAGTEFEVRLVLKIFEGDKEQELMDALNAALKIVEYNYLGGSGSRGYGKVKFLGETKEVFDVKAEVKSIESSNWGTEV